MSSQAVGGVGVVFHRVSLYSIYVVQYCVTYCIFLKFKENIYNYITTRLQKKWIETRNPEKLMFQKLSQKASQFRSFVVWTHPPPMLHAVAQGRPLSNVKTSQGPSCSVLQKISDKVVLQKEIINVLPTESSKQEVFVLCFARMDAQQPSQSGCLFVQPESSSD